MDDVETRKTRRLVALWWEEGQAGHQTAVKNIEQLLRLRKIVPISRTEWKVVEEIETAPVEK